MSEADVRLELGQFLRAHRERMPLEAAAAGRRRTPGLRREEVAASAGVSTTWLTFLEQGRQVNASSKTLSRIANALSLTRAERSYLFGLAGRHDPEYPVAAIPPDAPATLEAAVSALTHPAYGLDPAWNACCWNAPAMMLFAGWLDGDHERNLLRFVFLSPASRQLIPDWEHRARRLLAEFRADYSRCMGNPQASRVLEELQQKSPLFRKAWREQEVLDREGGLRKFQHPLEGDLAFMQHTMVPADRPDFKLVLLVPSQAS